MAECAIRVLALTADYPPDTCSGIGAAVATQVGALAARPDAAVRVLVGAPAGRPGREPSGVVMPLSRRRCPVRPGEFDVLHLHSLPLAELAVQMHHRLGLPLVTTAHSLLHRELAGWPGAEAAERAQAALLRASDAVILVSGAERDAALARYPELAARCAVLPNGVPPPPPPRPAPDGPVVFAGRFTRAKGVDLVAGVAEAAAAAGRDLVLAGGRPDDLGDAVVAGLARRPGCRVLGRLPHPAVEDLLRRAALVVVPSRYEPFGMVALEAMRVGTPVLAAATGGLPEVVGPGSGGRLVTEATPAAWRAATAELLDAPALRAELSRRGPAYAARRHDPGRLGGRLLDEVFRPLLAPPARPVEVVGDHR